MNTFLQVNDILSPLLLVVTSLGMGVLAIAVYRANTKSATNTIFILLSLSILLWLFCGYLAGLPQLAEYVIIFHRLAIFFAAPMSALFFLLAYTIPRNKLTMRKRDIWLVITLTLIMMAVNISPYAFVSNATTSAADLTPG